MTWFSPILLQVAGADNVQLINLIMIGAMVLIFWLFIFRPQNKKAKEQRSFLTDLKKGDQIVTTGGIVGKITKLEEQLITLEISNKTYLRVTRNAVSKEMTEMINNVED